MIGRIILYGLAFGSATAAMVLIQYYNGLYAKPGTFAAFVPFFMNMAIPGVGIYLFVKSMIANPGKSPINLGKALFFSLLTGLIMSFCAVGAYSHIYNNRHDLIAHQEQLQLNKATEIINNDKSIKPEAKPAKIEEIKTNIHKNLGVFTFGSLQVSMILGVTMVVALLIFLYNYKK